MHDRSHPRDIRIETPDYIVRTMKPSDARDGFHEWLLDPQAVRNLNAKASRLSDDGARAHIASFNNDTSYLLGIFAKPTDRLVGIRAVYVDWKRSEFVVNVLIDPQARDKGARTQSRAAVYGYFFEDLDLHVARASVLAVNEVVMAGMAKRGWVQERSDYKPAVRGGEILELCQFRLTRSAWRELASGNG